MFYGIRYSVFSNYSSIFINILFFYDSINGLKLHLVIIRYLVS